MGPADQVDGPLNLRHRTEGRLRDVERGPGEAAEGIGPVPRVVLDTGHHLRVAAWQFRYWLRRLAAEGSSAVGSRGFAEVSSPGWGLRLRLPGGLVLEIGHEFDEATLRRFLRAAAEPC
jgi:hypothetical protein